MACPLTHAKLATVSPGPVLQCAFPFEAGAKGNCASTALTAEFGLSACSCPSPVEVGIVGDAKAILSALLAEARKSVADKVTFDPKKYRLEWGGEIENQQRAEARFRLILGLILGVMIILLYAEFGVLRQALLILGVVPLATLGGLIALHLTGTTLNVASGVGFIALFGVAVMNGVIMVANLNHVRERGVPLFEAVLIGAGERLRPVLMTASVATVGMLPAALATGIGSDVQRGVATVVAGGLIILVLGGPTCALVGALVLGLAIGAEIDLIAFLVGLYFPQSQYGRTYGALYAVFLTGGATGPALFGYLQQVSGDYRMSLLCGAGLLCAAAGLTFRLLRSDLPEPAEHG